MTSKARIRLLGTDPKELAKLCNELKQISERTGVRMKGPVPLPTRRIIIPVRKSPCGNGTQTWDHFELKIHKRLIDIDAEEKAMRALMRIQVPDDIRVEIQMTGY